MSESNVTAFPAPVIAPDSRLLVMRLMVQELIGRANALSEIRQQSLLAARPVDMAGIYIETMAAMMRSMAFLIDDLLAAEGQAREMKFHVHASGDSAS